METSNQTALLQFKDILLAWAGFVGNIAQLGVFMQKNVNARYLDLVSSSLGSFNIRLKTKKVAWGDWKGAVSRLSTAVIEMLNTGFFKVLSPERFPVQTK